MDRQTLEFMLDRKVKEAYALRKRLLVLDNQYRIIHAEIVDLREALIKRDEREASTAQLLSALECAR